MKKLVAISGLMFLLLQAMGQTPVLPETEQDHNRMLHLLHIDTLRPGATNKPGLPNTVNYDEAKANPYPVLPNPLKLNNGLPVRTAQTWWSKRRPEILEDFNREVYGRLPEHLPAVRWHLVSTRQENNGGVAVITKKLIGQVNSAAYAQDTVNIELWLSTPVNAAKPVPVIMQIGVQPGLRQMPAGNGPNWQQQLLARGWGYAVIVATSIQPDNGAGLSMGIIGLAGRGHLRKADDWGALRAWAWGCSSALDYLETDRAVDAKRIGLEGHSRYGKAALVAMAYDERFAIAYISSSGEGGAKLSRRNAGEIVENVAAVKEYHWMAPNFMKYAGPLHWNDLPVDAHELIALCAPRPVFISAGNRGDEWVDARGMFMAAAAAGPVYTLLGKKDMGMQTMPPPETALTRGELAFRQHNAGHTDVPNWPYFIEFAARYFKY